QAHRRIGAGLRVAPDDDFIQIYLPMIRPILAVALAVFAAVPAVSFAAATVTSVVRIEDSGTPAGDKSVGGSITPAPDGTAWLSWVDPSAGNSLRFSRFDSGSGKWSVPQTISS